jgi:hypothetical protein
MAIQPDPIALQDILDTSLAAADVRQSAPASTMLQLLARSVVSSPGGAFAQR